MKAEPREKSNGAREVAGGKEFISGAAESCQMSNNVLDTGRRTPRKDGSSPIDPKCRGRQALNR